MKLNKNSSVIRLMKKLAKSKLSGITIGKLEQLAAKMGVDERELLQLYIDTKNNASRKRFAATPYSDRVLLLPQCLRSRECQAQLSEYGYKCQQCRKCGIPDITSQAKQLGYKDVFIMPGGSVAVKILQKEKPKACLGVSCLKELVLGSFVCERLGVAGQGVPLLRDGCVETAVNWIKVNKVLRLNPSLSN
ncbi:MAG: DUF116 domain-containing protein [Candidatus Bathyarchaeota archaeon]|nr:MAG: DUF116 domain-containing protein [Candidatus Bathyarchaeota archaeon]